MNIINKTIVLFFIIGGIAHADTLDYRHEYIDNGKNKDRLKLTHKFDSGVKFSVEVRWKGAQKPYNNIQGDGHKETIAYDYKLYDFFTVSPELAIQSNENALTYKPAVDLRLNTPSYGYTGFKFTYEYTKESENKPKTEVDKSEVYAGKKFGPVDVKLNYTYKQSPDTVLSNNNKNDSQYRFMLNYDVNKSFTPYLEVANVSGSKTKNERQTRYRVGIKYNF